MTIVRRLLLLSLLSLTSVLAQDLTGSYALVGRYSTRRGTAVELELSQGANGLEARRVARYTGWRFRAEPPLLWTSSEVRQAGRIVQVTYTLDANGAPSSLIERLDADQDPGDAAVAGVRAGNVLRAYYRVSPSGEQIEELVVNATRRASEGWWYWIRTSGRRRTPPPPPPAASTFVDGFQARGIQDPSLYYYFNVQPSSLTGIKDPDATDGLRRNPLDVTFQRIAFVRAMIWDSTLRFRLETTGPDAGLVTNGGTWRVGTVTDPNDGAVYEVVHWQDLDDNSFSIYYKDGTLYSIYYEN